MKRVEKIAITAPSASESQPEAHPAEMGFPPAIVQPVASANYVRDRKMRVLRAMLDSFKHIPEKPIEEIRENVIPGEEIAKHNKPDDIWVVHKGYVYDLTPYLKFHPGGVQCLLRSSGGDLTNITQRVHPFVNVAKLCRRLIIGVYSGKGLGSSARPGVQNLTPGVQNLTPGVVVANEMPPPPPPGGAPLGSVEEEEDLSAVD